MTQALQVRPPQGSSTISQQLSLIFTLADQIKAKDVDLELIPDYSYNLLNIKHLSGLDDDLLLEMYELFIDFKADLEVLEGKLAVDELQVRDTDDYFGNPTTEFFSEYTNKILWLENAVDVIGKELDLRASSVKDNSFNKILITA